MEKYFYRVEAVIQNNNKIGKCGEEYALSCYPSNMNKNSFYFEDQLSGSGFTYATNERLDTCD